MIGLTNECMCRSVYLSSMYVCIYLYIFPSIYVSMYPCTYVCMYPCMYLLLIYVSITFLFTHPPTHAHVCVYVSICLSSMYVSIIYPPMSLCIYLCAHVCVFPYVCICISFMYLLSVYLVIHLSMYMHVSIHPSISYWSILLMNPEEYSGFHHRNPAKAFISTGAFLQVL
jgi:hypothetical protein